MKQEPELKLYTSRNTKKRNNELLKQDQTNIRQHVSRKPFLGTEWKQIPPKIRFYWNSVYITKQAKLARLEISDNFGCLAWKNPSGNLPKTFYKRVCFLKFTKTPFLKSFMEKWNQRIEDFELKYMDADSIFPNFTTKIMIEDFTNLKHYFGFSLFDKNLELFSKMNEKVIDIVETRASESL